MEITRDLVKMQFRKLWSLYLYRRQICKRLEKQNTAAENQIFVKHFQEETQQFLQEMAEFDWIRDQKCLPALHGFENLHEINNKLLNTYLLLQSDTSWENEYPELARFLMRSLGRVKASIQLLQYLYFPPVKSI
ncbi:MAG: hypothetical protein U0X91_06425 [Spirosomataceae bacterium]